MIEKIKFVHVLTFTLIIIAASVIFIVMLSPDYEHSNMRTQAITAVLLAFATGYGFWLNSTSDSQKKTDMIAKSTKLPEKDDNL